MKWHNFLMVSWRNGIMVIKIVTWFHAKMVTWINIIMVKWWCDYIINSEMNKQYNDEMVNWWCDDTVNGKIVKWWSKNVNWSADMLLWNRGKLFNEVKICFFHQKGRSSTCFFWNDMLHPIIINTHFSSDWYVMVLK